MDPLGNLNSRAKNKYHIRTLNGSQPFRTLYRTT